MAQGDFLRAIYNDMDAVWYSKHEGRVASRRFAHENGRLIVEFLDQYNDRVGYAVETLSRGEPEVEFYDRHGSRLGYAILAANVLRADSIEVYWGSSKVREISVTDEQLRRIREDSTESCGTVTRNETRSAEVQRSSDAESAEPLPGCDPAAPLLIAVMVFLTFGLEWLFSAFHANLGSIIHFASLFVVKYSCPLMAVLFLLFCRIGKTAPRELRTFYWIHLLICIVSFLWLAWLHAGVYRELGAWPFRFSPYNLPLVCSGLPHFLLCFVPIFLGGFVSGLWTLRLVKQKKLRRCEAISRRFMRLLQTGSLVLITATQYIMLFYSSYVPNSIGNIFLMLLFTAFMGLLILLAWAIARVPYRLFIRRLHK